MNCTVRRRIKVIILNGFLSAISIGAAWGQKPRAHTVRAVAIAADAPPHPQLSTITFLTSPTGAPVHSLGADQGTLSLGAISYFLQPDVNGVTTQRQKGSLIVSSTFDLRIDFTHGHRTDTATVSAYLLSATPLATVSVDGVQLSMTPGIIGRQISYGAVTEHQLQIVVPMSMPAGQLCDSIGVLVTPN